ncbi:hypothetical protein ACU4GD_15055 [Cupriavidus basilensis]
MPRRPRLQTFGNTQYAITRRHEPDRTARKGQRRHVIALGWQDFPVSRHDDRLGRLCLIQGGAMHRRHPTIRQRELRKNRWHSAQAKRPRGGSPSSPAAMHSGEVQRGLARERRGIASRRLPAPAAWRSTRRAGYAGPWPHPSCHDS